MHLIREQHIQPSEIIIVLAFNRAVVFEIKKRLQLLFRSLGYAAYETLAGFYIPRFCHAQLGNVG